MLNIIGVSINSCLYSGLSWAAQSAYFVFYMGQLFIIKIYVFQVVVSEKIVFNQHVAFQAVHSSLTDIIVLSIKLL